MCFGHKSVFLAGHAKKITGDVAKIVLLSVAHQMFSLNVSGVAGFGMSSVMNWVWLDWYIFNLLSCENCAAL